MRLELSLDIASSALVASGPLLLNYGIGPIGQFAIGEQSTGNVNTLDPSIPIGMYADSVLWQPGSTPPSNPPNSYTKGDLYRNVTITVPIGVTSLQVVGVPYTNTQLNGPPTTIGVFIDNVYSQDLTYSGTLGVRATQTLTLDGAAHTIRFEEGAALVNIIGNFSYVTPTAPNTRVVCVGDSITARYAATIMSNSWFSLMRKALNPATFGCTNFGQTGRTIGGSSTTTTAAFMDSIASRLDGTSKNIIVIALMINDWNAGIARATTTADLSTLVTGLHSRAPSALILLSSSPQSANAGGGGGTIQQYRDILSAQAAATPTYTSYLDNSALYPGGTPWTTSTSDGIHPTDAGMVSLASAIGTAVQAL